MDESHAGMLLIASPRLYDPNFYRTVVLLFQHDDDGSMGVVLNRVTTEKVSDHLPAWGDRAAEPGLVHFGGPVEPEVASGVSAGAAGEATGVPGLSIVDLGTDPGVEMARVRVYSGYAGWGQGQLEAELAEGSWYLVQASPDDPFADPDSLWSRVLRRQQGHLALVSTFPDDVSLN